MAARSLRQFDAPADRIRQHRSGTTDAIVLVEGIDDYNVLRPHLEDVAIFPLDGRPAVLSTAESLASWAVERFIAVIDRDFEAPGTNELLDAHLAPYDGIDLEAMLIGLGVLKEVLQHHASHAKLDAEGGAEQVANRLVKATQPVAALREYNASNQSGLRFDAVELAAKYDKDTLQLNVRSYATALVAASDTALSVAEVVSIMQAERNSLETSGKDVLCVAGVAMRKLIATLPLAACSGELLGAHLRSSAAFLLSRSEWLHTLRNRLALGISPQGADGSSADGPR